MIKYITEYLLGYSETPSGTTEIALCFLCRLKKHDMRSVFSAVFNIYLLRVWFPEQKDLQGIRQQLMPSGRVSHLIIYAGCGQRAGTFFVTSLLSLCFWDALIPWRPNSLHAQCRSVPQIQGYSGILLGKILRRKSVASSHSCDFVPCWTIPGQEGYVCSSKLNTAKAELQHQHAVVPISRC